MIYEVEKMKVSEKNFMKYLLSKGIKEDLIGIEDDYIILKMNKKNRNIIEKEYFNEMEDKVREKNMRGMKSNAYLKFEIKEENENERNLQRNRNKKEMEARASFFGQRCTID